MARHTLRAVSGFLSHPAKVLEELNNALLANYPDGRLCTAVAARLVPGEYAHEVRVARGGHPYPLVVRADGQVEVLTMRGTGLGLLPQVRFTESTIDLRHGDQLILYTDGVTDARGPGGDYGLERLTAVAGTCAGAAADHTVDTIIQSVLSYRRAGADDVAVLVLRATPTGDSDGLA